MSEVKVESYKSKNPCKLKCINEKKETFRAPTPLLEDLFFKHGAAHGVADCKDTKNNLSIYSAINYKHGAAASAKAIKEIIIPELMVPTIEEIETNNMTKIKI